MRPMEIIHNRNVILNKHLIKRSYPIGYTVLCSEWNILDPNCSFDFELFDKLGIEFICVKPKMVQKFDGTMAENIYGIIDICVKVADFEMAKAFYKSTNNTLVIDCSGGMLCIENKEYMKTVLDRLPDGVWHVIGFDMDVLHNKAFRNKKELEEFFNSSELKAGGGTSIKCLEDFYIDDDAYLLSDGYIHEDLPKDWHGIKVFKETWLNGDNDHENRVVMI